MMDRLATVTDDTAQGTVRSRQILSAARSDENASGGGGGGFLIHRRAFAFAAVRF